MEGVTGPLKKNTDLIALIYSVHIHTVVAKNAVFFSINKVLCSVFSSSLDKVLI